MQISHISSHICPLILVFVNDSYLKKNVVILEFEQQCFLIFIIFKNLFIGLNSLVKKRFSLCSMYLLTQLFIDSNIDPKGLFFLRIILHYYHHHPTYYYSYYYYFVLLLLLYLAIENHSELSFMSF